MNNKNGTDRLLIYIMEKSDIEELRIFHNEDSTLLNLTDINHISELQQEKWFSSLSLSNTSKRYTVRLRKNNKGDIPVIKANEEELREHKEFCEKINEASRGRCIWNISKF